MADTKRYTPHDFSKVRGLTGISDKQLEEHLKLYEGYVKRTNALTEKLEAMCNEGKASGADPVFAELTRRLGFEYGGKVNHEYYFANLIGGAQAEPPAGGKLRKAIEGRLALDHRVEAKRRIYPPPRHEVPVQVRVHPDASDFFTVVEVGASDRIGLLFDVTRTFADLRLDVHLAKVATYGARVVDAFYVRDVLGRKLDEEQVAELERALLARFA